MSWRKDMSTRPEAGSPEELPWLRGFEEARNHFLEEIKKLEVKIASLEKDEKMFLNEHDENVRLHFENVELKEENTRLREVLKFSICPIIVRQAIQDRTNKLLISVD